MLRYRHLTIGERLRVMAGGVRLLRMRRRDLSRLQTMTVAQLMDELGQGEGRAKLLVSARDRDSQRGPEARLGRVARRSSERAFFARRSDSAFVYSRVGLSDLYCKPAAAFIERAGGVVCVAQSVEALEIENGNVARVRLRDGTRIAATNYVCRGPAAPVARAAARFKARRPILRGDRGVAKFADNLRSRVARSRGDRIRVCRLHRHSRPNGCSTSAASSSSRARVIRGI